MQAIKIFIKVILDSLYSLYYNNNKLRFHERFQVGRIIKINSPRIQVTLQKRFLENVAFLLPMWIKHIQKTVFITASFLFIFCCISFANNSSNQLQIPSQFGSLKEFYEAKEQSDKAPLIIQIQDAHCNYEAQKNLAQIIDHLVREKKLRLVMVEGGSGDVSLSFLRSFTDKKSREAVADRYLRSGKISGEEYLDIISDYDLELYGIEDQGLYDSNLDSFLNIDGFKDQGIKDINGFKNVVEALKPLMLNAGLLQLEEKVNVRELFLSDKSAYLSDIARKKGIDLGAYPQVAAFLDSSEAEKKIDFNLAEQQRAAFIKEIAKKLDDAAVKQLISQTQSFKDKKISPAEFYGFLRKIAQDKIDLKKSYPQFESYMRYIISGKKIDAEKLVKEVAALEEAVRESMFLNNDERRLVDISKKMDMLERFLRLDLTPEEYAAIDADKSGYMTASWANFLADNCRKYKLTVRPEVSEILDDNFDKIDSFYKVGMEREQAFLKNIKERIAKSPEDQVVAVITGGFHTARMSKLFRREGYSYAVVTPAITKKNDPELYFSVLREDKEPLPDYIGAEE